MIEDNLSFGGSSQRDLVFVKCDLAALDIVLLQFEKFVNSAIPCLDRRVNINHSAAKRFMQGIIGRNISDTDIKKDLEFIRNNTLNFYDVEIIESATKLNGYDGLNHTVSMESSHINLPENEFLSGSMIRYVDELDLKNIPGTPKALVISYRISGTIADFKSPVVSELMWAAKQLNYSAFHNSLFDGKDFNYFKGSLVSENVGNIRRAVDLVELDHETTPKFLLRDETVYLS